MRRGGGSRGGGSRGGGSRGGGSRGGGSRGGGFRGGSSRMHRSSRRNYHHRSYYGPRRYYHHGYYGSRRRYYGGGDASGALFVFLIIILFIVALFVAASMSSSENYTIELASETSYSLDYSRFSDGAVNIEATAGIIRIYTFDNEPRIASTKDTLKEYSGTLFAAYDYEWYGISLGEGSSIRATWSATFPLTYYAIRGESNLNSWEDGNDNQFYDSYGTTGSHNYDVSRADTYYFAVETQQSNNPYQISFTISLPVHDISNPNQEFTGSQYLLPEDFDGSSIIIFNPSLTEDASIVVEVESAFSFGQVFLVLLILIVGGSLLFRRRSNNKNRQSGNSTPDQIPAKSSEQLAQSTNVKPGTSEKPAKPMDDEEFITRPNAKFCVNCGSGILPESKFCIECGQST